MSLRGAAALLMALLAGGPVAAAQDIHVDPLDVRGPATLEDVHVAADCVDHEQVRQASCALLYRFRLRARGAVELRGPDSVRVDGAPLEDLRRLADGESVEVAVVYRTLQLDVERGAFFGIIQPANGLRHPLLGESWLWYQRRHYAEAGLVNGEDVRIEGVVDVREDTGSEATLRYADGRVTLALDAPHVVEIEGAFDHGGPIVSVGGRWFLQPPNQGRVHLGLGYELGLTDFFFLSVMVETDLDSLYESVLIEAALPGLIFTVPGLGVGVGAVARQLGPRDADAALRVRVSAQWFAVGLAADFDYWPALGRWTGVVRGRVSL